MRFIQKFVFFVFLVFGSVSKAEVYDVSTTAELREALASAATNGEDDTIVLANGTYKTTDDGEGTFVYFSDATESLTLEGSSAENVTISGGNEHQILSVEGPFAILNLRGICFSDGNSADNAGGVSVSNGWLMVVDSKFVNNNSQNGSGGGFSSEYADVSNSVFQNNSAPRGGGFYSRRVANVSYSEFRGNSAFEDDGGAILTSSPDDTTFLSVRFSQFYDNYAKGSGGAILAYAWEISGDKPISISNSGFYNNSSGSMGGAIALADNSPVPRGHFVHNSEFIMNDSPSGSAIVNLSGSLIVGNLLLAKNTGSASIFFPYLGPLTINAGSISNSIFHENTLDLAGVITPVLFHNYINISKVESPNVIDQNNVFENIDLGFFDEPNDDYRLTGSSDLIDIGKTSVLAQLDLANAPYKDLGGNDRVIGPSVDIGPYEYVAPDSDADGLNDNYDNCPSIANEDQADNDSDGQGDVCDSDDDNDGTNDEDDAFPFDDTESLDTDDDGIGNNEDYDDDADGILDSFDNAPLVVNAIVVDSDNDGVIDSVDAYPNDPNKQYSGSDDLDGDGFSNDEEIDYCTNPFDERSQPDIGGLNPVIMSILSEQGRP